MLNTTRAIIDLAALRHNLSVVRSLCPASQVMAMVKADAYGHGLLPVARALIDADGLAVARLDEALQLRNGGIDKRLLLLGSLLDSDDLQLCAQHNIDVTVHDSSTVQRVIDVAAKSPLRVWLKLDSGMHRLGLSPTEFRAADRQLRAAQGIIELLHLSHFSSADDLDSDATDRQIAQFFSANDDTHAPASIANSAALITRPITHTTWVRPGIMLYGENPVAKTHPLPLQPVMTLCASVLAIHALKTGEAVGYNQKWISARDSVIATIGIGYGDGYPRHAKNGTPVWINGQRYPLVGRVSMDSITVDITDANNIKIGDEAILWGPQLPVSIVAEHAETISYELLTAIGHRVPREYVG